MNNMVLVSVIMPAYNARAYIAEAIRSVLDQTISSWELIIVDDGSDDDTSDIVEEFRESDKRITLIKQRNKGEARARISGFNIAKGEYIYFLDSDDIALNSTLEKLICTLKEHPDAVAAYGNYLRINAEGKLLFPYGKDLNRCPKLSGNILEFLLKGSFFAVGAVMVRKKFLDQGDIFTETSYAEDWVMWVRLAMKGDFIFIGNNPLVKRRIHSDAQTRKIAVPDLEKKAISEVFKSREIKKFFSQNKLDKLRKCREAFSFFSIACKKYADRDYINAEKYFKNSLSTAYWRYPEVWVIYFLARIKWMPGLIKAHFG